MGGTRRLAAAGVVALMVGGCAALGGGALVQPPQFSAAQGQDAVLRVLGPSAGRPLGGAQLRIYARVQNPNAFGVTLAALQGNLLLEGSRAAQIDFPLGLPLRATTDTVIPLDVNISFADVPGLANAVQRIVTQNRVGYRLDGTVTLDAAPFGRPSFGPRTWLQGETQVVR